MFPPSMRSVFGLSPQGGTDNAPQSDIVGDFLTRVLPALRSNREQQMNSELANKIKLMNAGSNVERYGTSDPQRFVAPITGPGSAPTNTVMAPNQINPYQAAELALKKAAEEGKNTRASESIAGREGIASQAETGRTARATLRSTTQLQMSDDRIRQSMRQLGLKEDQFDYYKKLHNVPDDERIKMLQDGKISMEDLKNTHALEQIGARGANEISNTQERGKQQRQTQNSKLMTPQQKAVNYENKARELLNSNPEYAKYIKFNPDTNKFMKVENAGDDNIYHEINRQIYADDQPGSIDLPAEGKPKSSNELYQGGGKIQAPEDDTSPKNVTQYNKGDDPLGLFGGSEEA